jgi:hypothetical protein
VRAPHRSCRTGAARPARPRRSTDHDRGEGLTEGGFDRRFPSILDADQVEQRAEDAVPHALETGEVIGAGAGVGEVERHLQRLDPGRARGRGLGRMLPAPSGGLDCLAGQGGAPLGPLHLLDQRRLEQLGRRAVVAELVAELVELGRPRDELIETRTAPAQLVVDAFRRGDA